MIYFIQQGTDGPIKIGYTDDKIPVEKRLSQLQTGNPYPLILIATLDGQRDLEHALHERFGHKRLCGEWFKISILDITHVIKLVTAGKELKRVPIEIGYQRTIHAISEDEKSLMIHLLNKVDPMSKLSIPAKSLIKKLKSK